MVDKELGKGGAKGKRRKSPAEVRSPGTGEPRQTQKSSYISGTKSPEEEEFDVWKQSRSNLILGTKSLEVKIDKY
jgi:hypothetical protein